MIQVNPEIDGNIVLNTANIFTSASTVALPDRR